MFQNLIDKFITQLALKVYADLHEKQTLNEIKTKLNKILPFENFYTFMIQTDKDKMDVEKSELKRLIKDAQDNGKWIIKDFNFEKSLISLPVSFEYT